MLLDDEYAVKKQNIIKLYFLYRIIIMFLTIYVVGQFTILGDMKDYLRADAGTFFREGGWRALLNRTSAVKIFASLVKVLMLGNDLLTNLFFNMMAFYGVKKIIDEIKIDDLQRFKILIFLLFFPSFNIWSSIAGKEAVVVFGMGILIANVLRFFNGEKLFLLKTKRNGIRINYMLAIAALAIVIIKPQYVVAIAQLLLYLFFVQKVKISRHLEFLLILIIIAVNIFILYIFRDYIDTYSRLLTTYFRATARSTRESPFVNKYDVFRILPYGLFISTWGPTFEEMKISILHRFSFAESLALFICLLYMIKRSVYLFLLKMRIQLRRVFIVINTLFWLMFAQYIQGIMNPGSAIRYRTNFYLMLIVLFYSIYVYYQEGRYNAEKNL